MKKKKTMLILIDGKRYELEVELVKKVLNKTINETEINTLIERLKNRRGHLKSIKIETKH